ncbi:MAG: S9 family peptidase [Bacteroidota bacterium]|nr:S9 family peptidase [Bacteroidota bacterium]
MIKSKVAKQLVLLMLTFFTLIVQAQKNEKITLADLWKNYKYFPKSVRGLTSMDDGVHYSTLEKGKKIVKYSYVSGEQVAVIVDVDELGIDGLTRISGYTFNADESKILVYTNRENIYRRSFIADYFVITIESKKVVRLSDNGKQQLATFSPKDNKIAFVRKNNIFFVDLNTDEEKQITFDGKFNHIINGAPDWVYEEEFEFSQAFHWSPDGKKIAYIKFDESRVKEFNMTMYAGMAPLLKDNILYPENRHWKYPKAGDDNSIVSVHVYNLENTETVEMNVGEETDQYIPRIRWTQDTDVLSIFRLNRLQNKFDLIFADPDNGESKVIYTEENKYYIDEGNFDDLTFLSDGKHFVLTSEMDGWNHIYLMDLKGDIVRNLTKGEYDVTDYLGFDERKKMVYFQAAKQSPMQREVYSVKINGKDLKKYSEKVGTNTAHFSKGFKYYVNYFSNAKTPTFISLHNKNGKLIRVLEDNAAFVEKIEKLDYSLKEFFTFTTSENVELNGYMVKPVGFDENVQYPVVMTQYSGPNSQSVKDSWSFDWYNYLAQEGYIVVCVDGRGTGARGEEFRKMTYLQLGHYETIDQIEAAKYLSKLPYVDKDNMAIWGWSYGGFMTTLCMTKGDGIFKAGIAVAPVTNYRYYDNIYTERFMRTPQENPEGYNNNSPMNFADQLQGDLLLIHGSADDNVHVQNTMEFAEKLVQANKQFDMFIYNNRNHGIYGANTRYHLYTKMTNFLNEHLK